MLKSLHIQNYTIIEEIQIDFSNQLNIITGETGAGKSILMGALRLILGERADTSTLLDKSKKCFVEGIFIVNNKKDIKEFLVREDIEYENELVLRREINATGKSRAFINDTPASLQQLKNLASLLVDLHQQFDTLELGEANFQRKIIDALAENDKLLQQYQAIYHQWQATQRALTELQNQRIDFKKEADYHQFLFNELHELALKENELEQLEQELKLLSHSEDIKNVLTNVCFQLKEGDQPVVQHIKQLINQLILFKEFHADLASLIARLQTAQIELQDIADEVELINGTINFDQQRIEQINERLDNGYTLLKKHGVQSTKDLLNIQSELEEKLQHALHVDDAIDTKEKETQQLLLQAEAVALSIRKNRLAQAPDFEKNINQLLAQVGMPNARCKIALRETELHTYGNDSIEFLFDANKNNRFEPLSKVASGGELSRLMLCIKSLVAEKVDLPTMIFDEIDTGISGEAAKQVGIIMKNMAAQRQIVCITHQPQIAGKANTHLFVYKEIKGDTIQTNIRLLNQDERITVIAKMLSGEKPTTAAIENAREMLMN